MSRERTGSLEFKRGEWIAKVTVDVGDPPRPFRKPIKLGTTSRAEAEKMLVELVELAAAGKLEIVDVAATKGEIAKVEPRATAWCEARVDRGVACAKDERALFKRHVFPVIGPLLVTEVRKRHIVELLARVARTKGVKTGKPLARESVAHVRRLLSRFFAELENAEEIDASPVRGAKMPAMRDDERPRTALTEDEYNLLLACPENDVEIKVLVLTARMLGGARARECLHWDWSMIDVVDFRTCKLKRAKTNRTQDLNFPEVLRPFLQAWWRMCGEPTSGPVFPVSRGKRKGEQRGRGNGLAKRFRRAIERAHAWKGTPARREVLFDTPYSRRTDFHTLRRDFVGGLARAGTNMQSAMALASHSDADVHRRYLIDAERTIPPASLPTITVDAATAIVPKRGRLKVSGRPAAHRTSRNKGAGHGVRTRDIQLGKFSDDRACIEKPAGSDAASITELEIASERFQTPTRDSSPGDNSTGEIVSDEQVERAIVIAVLGGHVDLAESLRAMLVQRRHHRAGNVVAIDRTKQRT